MPPNGLCHAVQVDVEDALKLQGCQTLHSCKRPPESEPKRCVCANLSTKTNMQLLSKAYQYHYKSPKTLNCENPREKWSIPSPSAREVATWAMRIHMEACRHAKHDERWKPRTHRRTVQRRGRRTSGKMDTTTTTKKIQHKYITQLKNKIHHSARIHPLQLQKQIFVLQMPQPKPNNWSTNWPGPCQISHIRTTGHIRKRGSRLVLLSVAKKYKTHGSRTQGKQVGGASGSQTTIVSIASGRGHQFAHCADVVCWFLPMIFHVSSRWIWLFCLTAVVFGTSSFHEKSHQINK